MNGKWLELLKEIAPGTKRVAVVRDPSVPAGSAGLAAVQTVAPSLGVELIPVGVRNAGEIERVFSAPDMAIRISYYSASARSARPELR
jgi:putative tryptophan/tyrosine transport system substrate-binding protein